MFERGKVYKTAEGKPAKILWVFSSMSGNKGLVALHDAYSEYECVLQHLLSGRCFNDDIIDDPMCDLTEEEYA